MKTRFLQLSAILLGSALTFTSCNKQEIEDLENDLASTQSQLDDANSALSAAGIHTGPDEVIFFNMSGNRGVDSVAFEIDWEFNVMTDDKYDYSYYEDNGDGTYYIYVERSDTPEWENYAYFEFNYDPSDGSVSEFYQYSEGYFQMSDHIMWADQEGYYNYTGETDITTINSVSFDVNTRQLSIDFTTVDTEVDNYNYTDNASTTNVTFTGTLATYYGDYLWKTAQ